MVGKCGEHISHILSQWPFLWRERERILSSFSRWRERAAFLELLVWIVTYAYHLRRWWNDNDTAATPIRRPAFRWKTFQLGRTNWISFPIQPTVNSNDSRGESRQDRRRITSCLHGVALLDNRITKLSETKGVNLLELVTCNSLTVLYKRSRFRSTRTDVCLARNS